MDRLPWELLTEIAEWCSTYDRRGLLNLSRTSKHVRNICIPIIYGTISLHDNIDDARDQVDALVESGLVAHLRCLKFGIASFLTRQCQEKIVHEATRRYYDGNWARSPDSLDVSGRLSPYGWDELRYSDYAPPVQRPDSYPSYLNPADAETILHTLFTHCSPRLKAIQVRNVASLGTEWVNRINGDPTNHREATCDARDHIIFSMAACEGDFISGLESASRHHYFPNLLELNLNVFKFMNTMTLICNPGSDANPLMKSAERLVFDAIHPRPESVDMLDIMMDGYNHNHIMYLLGALSVYSTKSNGGRRKCLNLGFKNYPTEGLSDLVPFPLVNNLTALSLENLLLLEGSLDRTIVASPYMTSLKLKGIRLIYGLVIMPPSSSDSDLGDRPRIRERHAWASLLSLCSTSLHRLTELELSGNNYYRPSHRLSFGEDELPMEYAASSHMLRSTSRADYQALKKLLGAVRTRRLAGGMKSMSAPYISNRL